MVLAVFLPALTFAQSGKPDAANTGKVTANYELASRWTQQKVGKLVFDTSVTPHWLEFSDRFWYSFETNSGKSNFLVDPGRKSKIPLFDNAKMAHC
jgi:hypothetical protein